MRSRLVALGLLLALTLTSCAAAQGDNVPVEVPFLSADDYASGENGLRIEAAEQLAPRTYRIFLSSESVADSEFSEGNSVVVTLPVGFSMDDQYPVVYLLNGSGADGGATQWSSQADTESLLGDRQSLLVMPDGGPAGWYSDWQSRQGPKWETYHLEELVPWVDDHLPTIVDRDARAIGGVSMGGYGAVHYAIDRDDLFSEVFSLSGVLSFSDESSRAMIEQQIRDIGAKPGALFGSLPDAAENGWHASDPRTGAEELSDTGIRIVAGTGTRGTNLEDSTHLEWAIRQTSESFMDRLDELDISYEYREFSPGAGCDGGHNWGCWTPEAKKLLNATLDAIDPKITGGP